MNPKGKKTTIVAYIALALILSFFVALFMKLITMNELKDGIGAVTAAAVVIIGILSKDVNETHTKS